MKFLYYFVLSLLVFSCKDPDREYRKKIIGDWKFEEKLFNAEYYKRYQLPAPPIVNAFGYSFYQDGTFKVYNHSDFSEKLKHIIQNDSISLQNPSDKKWKSFKLIGISSDTLSIMFDDKVSKKFSRVKYHESGKSGIDRIIISSSGCFGTCPVESLSVDSNGNILFMGDDYAVKEGFYTSHVSANRFKKILAGFEKADFENLNDSYYANHTDDETITITFVRNDSIIKTIEDYGHKAPAEFIWAYTHLRHISQRLNLKKKNEDVKDFPISQMFFRKDNQQGKIAESEMFMLYTAIQKAKITDVVFENKYALKLWFDDYTKAIYTDGRYFSLPGNPAVTLDLGYNFFERNNLEARLKPIEE